MPSDPSPARPSKVGSPAVDMSTAGWRLSGYVWTTSTTAGTVPNMTEEEQAQAQGEQDAAIALAEEDDWQIVSGGMLTVHPVEEWVPRARRRAYLDGAASVLGDRPLIMA